ELIVFICILPPPRTHSLPSKRLLFFRQYLRATTSASHNAPASIRSSISASMDAMEKRIAQAPKDVESDSSSLPSHDSTHRKLNPRHIYLIGIGGTIGTALFVAIGRGLLHGGPGSLFIAFTVWCVTNPCLLKKQKPIKKK